MSRLKKFFFLVVIISLSPKAGERAGRAPGARGGPPLRCGRDAGSRCRRLALGSRAPRSPPSATPRGRDQQFAELICDALNF